jgi:hypothetical protein
MLEPFELPHECESAEIAELLARLNPRQRRVLRSYVWQVELGELTVTAWLAGEKCPVRRPNWYDARPGKGRFWGNADFQRALAAYKLAGLRWQVGQEERQIAQAQRRIRHAAPAAAERLVDQVNADMGAFFRISERWTDEPLPSDEIIQEDDREDKKGKKLKFYLVRRMTFDMTKLTDPRYSKQVSKFSDSPMRGVSIELYSAQKAAEGILDRSDLKTASKAAMALTGPEGGAIEIAKTYVTISPDDWDEADSDVQPAAVADPAVA